MSFHIITLDNGLATYRGGYDDMGEAGRALKNAGPTAAKVDDEGVLLNAHGKASHSTLRAHQRLATDGTYRDLVAVNRRAKADAEARAERERAARPARDEAVAPVDPAPAGADEDAEARALADALSAAGITAEQVRALPDMAAETLRERPADDERPRPARRDLDVQMPAGWQDVPIPVRTSILERMRATGGTSFAGAYNKLKPFVAAAQITPMLHAARFLAVGLEPGLAVPCARQGCDAWTAPDGENPPEPPTLCRLCGAWSRKNDGTMPPPVRPQERQRKAPTPAGPSPGTSAIASMLPTDPPPAASDKPPAREASAQPAVEAPRPAAQSPLYGERTYAVPLPTLARGAELVLRAVKIVEAFGGLDAAERVLLEWTLNGKKVS